MKDFLIHEGVGHDEDPPGRGSGRYAWGSGANPYQHQFNFIAEVRKYRKKGFKDSEIAKILLGEHATTTDLKIEIGLAEKEDRRRKIDEALKYLDQAHGNKLQASKLMGISPSSYYKLVDEKLMENTDKYENTAKRLKERIDKLGQPIDITSGTEHYLGVTKDTLARAVGLLERQGYIKCFALVPQQGTHNKTIVSVICPPGTEFNERLNASGKPMKWVSWRNTGIGTIDDFSPDGGKTFWVPKYPTSMNPDRIYVRYAEEGGSDRDGVIEIRKNVADLSLGKSRYAQVRILVDNDHYMKGMAIYSDDVPAGYDVVYNSNKKMGSSFDKVFKGCKVSIPPEVLAKKMKISTEELASRLHKKTLVVDTVDDLVKVGFTRDQAKKYIDKDNPFGASIKAKGQDTYEGADGKQHQTLINKLSEEGDWDSWSRNLSAQFLSKQPMKLINQQLDLSLSFKHHELEQIKKLTNPVIKQQLLEDFARGCDANAADLSAKGFRNQAFQVLVPVNGLKDTECYAPRFKDGEQVALVRYPYAGPFESPKLTVNNKHKVAKSLLGNAVDAIGINKNVAAQMSGADFDGDTALVIPLTSNHLTVKTEKPLKALEGFDTKMYKVETDKPTISNRMKQRQMGETTNLIADMTLAGAPTQKIAKVVKHSMVVIDSEKHNLDWKRSERENDIISLKKEYQGVNPNGTAKGASTIITRAKGQAHVLDRKVVTDVKKMTPEQKKRFENGEVIYVETGKQRMDYKKGKLVDKTNKLHGMDTVRDAYELVREPSNPKEAAYANYANGLKALANAARKESRSIKPIHVSPEAKKTYAHEVATLKEQVKRAQMNAPKERKAQEIAGAIVSEKFKANPEMDYEHKQRERARALNQARAMVGASKDKVKISDREWEAIQANAVSTNLLKEVLKNTDQDAFKQRATPRRNANAKLSSNELRLAKSMYSSNMYTLAEIAERLGISVSTVSKAIKGE